jgi:hypothetical protein
VSTDPHRVSDAAVLASLTQTLRTQIVPALEDPWTRTAAIQLAALAELIRTRPPDAADQRAGELARLLDELGQPGAVAWSYDEVLAACSAALASWSLDDPRRARLRAALIAHLDADLAVNMALMGAFRGQLPDA